MSNVEHNNQLRGQKREHRPTTAFRLLVEVAGGVQDIFGTTAVPTGAATMSSNNDIIVRESCQAWATVHLIATLVQLFSQHNEINHSLTNHLMIIENRII